MMRGIPTVRWRPPHWSRQVPHDYPDFRKKKKEKRKPDKEKRFNTRRKFDYHRWRSTKGPLKSRSRIKEDSPIDFFYLIPTEEMTGESEKGLESVHLESSVSVIIPIKKEPIKKEPIPEPYRDWYKRKSSIKRTSYTSVQKPDGSWGLVKKGSNEEKEARARMKKMKAKRQEATRQRREQEQEILRQREEELAEKLEAEKKEMQPSNPELKFENALISEVDEEDEYSGSVYNSTETDQIEQESSEEELESISEMQKNSDVDETEDEYSSSVYASTEPDSSS